MKTKLWSALLLIATVSPCTSVQAAREDASEKASVQQLITQLGDEEYLLRQQAEVQLMERGAEAFAELQAAERHADLEISTRAKYILNQISIEWVRPTDPPVVKSIMGRFGDLASKARLRKVGELAKLEDEQGFGALCRIARYESSGQIARYAALAILENGLLPTARTDSAVAALSQEMGESQETPITWVRVYVDQLVSPDHLNSQWVELLDEEIELLAEETGETTERLVLAFLRSHLDTCDHFSDAEAILAALERRIEFGDDEAMSARLIDALTWLIDREQWPALALLEDQYVDEIKQDRLVLYHLAVACEKQGRAEDAEALAERALKFEVLDAEQRNDVADIVGELGHHDWAEREWQAVIDNEAATSPASLGARQSLGLLRINDRLEHKAAADLLTETISGIDGDVAIKQKYQTDPVLWFHLSSLRSHRDYFLACHHESLGAHEKQREFLEKAYRLDPSNNADILIAMYHSPDASKSYRKTVKRRVAKSLRKVEAEMRNAKTKPHWYNHWAWLVSNTEGDFKKAVKYSEFSLKLAPESASYLDTLGRCYYSAGDLENAIKVQREAIAKHPHLLVMQRQLQQFEDALEKRDADEAGK